MLAYTRKVTSVHYFSTHRICLEYKPLAQPKREYALYRMENGEEVGYFCTKREYDAANVPEEIHDSANDRRDWERRKAEEERNRSHRPYVSW